MTFRPIRALRACLLAAISILFSFLVYAKQPDENSAYVEKLRAKYMSRITFQTPYAREAVMGFVIDCKAKDGRSLPLINVMLAKLDSMDKKKTPKGDTIWLAERVDSRGEVVRAYDQMVKNGHVIAETLVFEIDEWGSLHVKNIRAEAILNACYRGYGPIWSFE